MTFTMIIHQRRDNIKFEDGLPTTSMDIPSSPFGTSLVSSRRDSLVSSSTFSANSPMGTAGPNTPSSYTSQIPFEPSMADMAMPDLSFGNASFSNDYDTSFNVSNDYDQKNTYGWNNGRLQDDCNLNINLQLDQQQYHELQGQGLPQGLYNANNGDDVFHVQSPTVSELPWMCSGHTIVPRQMHNNMQYSIPLASAFSTPVKARRDYAFDLPLRSNQHQHYEQNYSPACYDASPLKRQSSVKEEVKKERKGRLSRPESSPKTSPKKQKQSVETKDGVKLEADVAEEAKHCCLWPCPTKFVRSEHMYRHLKDTHIGPARRAGLPIPDHIQDYITNKAANKAQVVVEETTRDTRPFCLVCDRHYSRNDNLTQHYDKVHFTFTAASRERRHRLVLSVNKEGVTIFDWPAIARYPPEVEERAHEFLRKEEEKRLRAKGVIDAVRPSRKGSKKEKYRQKNRLSSSPGSSHSNTAAYPGLHAASNFEQSSTGTLSF